MCGHHNNKYDLCIADITDGRHKNDDTDFIKLIKKPDVSFMSDCDQECESYLQEGLEAISIAYRKGITNAHHILSFNVRKLDIPDKRLRELVRTSMFEHVTDGAAEWEDADVDVEAEAGAPAGAAYVEEDAEGDLYDGRFLMSASELSVVQPGTLVLEPVAEAAGVAAGAPASPVEATPLGDWAEEDYEF